MELKDLEWMLIGFGSRESLEQGAVQISKEAALQKIDDCNHKGTAFSLSGAKCLTGDSTRLVPVLVIHLRGK
jgi:hypothetical protein